MSSCDAHTDFHFGGRPEDYGTNCAPIEPPRVAAQTPTVTGGSPEHLLQDLHRGLSQWLANQPDARLRVRERCAEIAAAQTAPDAPSQPCPTWQDAESISNLSNVDWAIRNLLDDPTANNATGAVLAVLQAHRAGAAPVAQQAAPEVLGFIDQIDAEKAARDWLNGMLPQDRSRAFWQWETFSFAPHDGRVHLLRCHEKPVAAALIVRDGLNRSQLLKWTAAAHAQQPVAQQAAPTLWQVMAAAKALHTSAQDGREWDELRQHEVDALRSRATAVLAAAHAQQPAQALTDARRYRQLRILARLGPDGRTVQLPGLRLGAGSGLPDMLDAGLDAATPAPTTDTQPVTAAYGMVWRNGALVMCEQYDREPCPHQPERRCADCPGKPVPTTDTGAEHG